jgi:hypothetical protein
MGFNAIFHDWIDMMTVIFKASEFLCWFCGNFTSSVFTSSSMCWRIVLSPLGFILSAVSLTYKPVLLYQEICPVLLNFGGHKELVFQHSITVNALKESLS